LRSHVRLQLAPPSGCFKLAMMDDSSLLQGLARDLDGSFEQLVRTYQDRLYGFALRLSGNRQDAEEATQDVFVRAYRALGGYPPERRCELRLRPWLYRIALNVVRNRVRRPVVATVPVDGPLANGLAAHPAQQPESRAMGAERWNKLVDALGALPNRYRTAVVLRHVQGLSYAEAAEVLDQPIGTTKSDVHRGLRLMRDRLEAELLVEARNA
jgi:RNA polymerase sigma factor (sigma-70 family)